MIGELALKDVTSAPDKKRLLKMNDEQKRQKEECIAKLLKVDPDYVIVNKLQLENPNYGSRSYDLNSEAIMIFDKEQKELRKLSDYAAELILARPPAEEAALETIQVCAPMEG